MTGVQVELASLYMGSAATDCAFSPDGRFILACTQKATLHLFNTTSYEEMHVLHGHTLGVRACSFTLDSSRILACGLDTLISVWQLDQVLGRTKHTHRPSALLRGHSQGVRAVACNPRLPDQIASGGDDQVSNCAHVSNPRASEQPRACEQPPRACEQPPRT